MKKIFLAFLFPVAAFSQSMQVDETNYTPKELIRDILVNSACIHDIQVTEAAGGNFVDGSRSFGYFDASGTSFPIKKGLVLSTGKVNSVYRPTSELSDDDTPGWGGDPDLNSEFGVNTYNATILEFDFIPDVSRISFRYLFASEEYQDGNPNTCRFSDVFAFFIRPAGTSDYQNIALVPNTSTPVSVTNVHPDITQNCRAVNETYFDKFNTNAPIVFNGQTTVLTASANVTAGEVYHVKLVIADDENYRFDSAVFLEAGSFQPTVDLGEDRLMSTGNPLCPDETYILDAESDVNSSYSWFKNGTPLSSETAGKLVVSEPGHYSVKVVSAVGCESHGEITIEYSQPLNISNTVLKTCDYDQDGLTVYDLFESEEAVTNENANLQLENFYKTEADAEAGTNPISDPATFSNTSVGQKVFARIEGDFGCYGIAEVTLDISHNSLELQPFSACDDLPVDAFTTISLAQVTSTFTDRLPADAAVHYFLSEEDASSNVNEITGEFTNTTAGKQDLFVRVTSDSSCYAISKQEIQVQQPPKLEPDGTLYYCQSQTEVLELEAGLLETGDYNFKWFFNEQPMEAVTETTHISQSGNYRVEVYSADACMNSRKITVIASELPIIENIEVETIHEQNRVTVEVSGSGNYEFALDSTENFQESFRFQNVAPGVHTIFVKDRNGCGITEQQVAVFGYKKYFTPNGDGINDVWKLEGINSSYNLLIFDRYGKLLIQLNDNHPEWNGRYGNRMLPSGDYWFKLELPDGNTLQGHFSLIR